MSIFTLIPYLIIFLSQPVDYQVQEKSEITLYVEDFQNETVNELPVKWYNQRGNGIPHTYDDELKSTYKYAIKEEKGNKFLQFEGIRGKHLSYPFFDEIDVNIYETPILSWDWRIHDLPKGANEDDKNKNDAAASIYVVYDLGHVLFRKVPKSIRYTWSSTLPVGTELSKFHGNQKIIVMGSGEEGMGEWHTFERNIVEDYQRLFGDPPPARPMAILILSDGNDTNDVAKADYDNILLKSSPSN